jgi:Nucleotidyltransferase
MPEPQNIVDSPGDDADVEGVQPHHPEQMLCGASTSPAADGATTTTSTAVGNRFQVLGYEQVNRLHRVMETAVPIHGRGNFPTLDVKLRSLVQVVRAKLKSDGIVVRDVRLNGGAASYILGNETCEVSTLELLLPYSCLSVCLSVCGRI